MKRRPALFYAKLAICLTLGLPTAESNAQTNVIWSRGPQGDSGIYVIQPDHPTTFAWRQSVSFSDVSVFARLASYGSPGTGWATLSLGNTQIAGTDFNYPDSWGAQLDLFDGLDLPPGSYSLTIGAYTGSDDGWQVPIDNYVYTADNVSYIGTYGWYSWYGPPVDCLVVSVPEPSTSSVLGLGLLVIAVLLRTRKTANPTPFRNTAPDALARYRRLRL